MCAVFHLLILQIFSSFGVRASLLLENKKCCIPYAVAATMSGSRPLFLSGNGMSFVYPGHHMLLARVLDGCRPLVL